MRLEDAGPRTWMLGAVAAWALAAWLLALAGMGGRIEPLPDDPALAQQLAVPAPPAEGRLGPLADYGAISARPVLMPERRPQPFSLAPESEAPVEETFDYQLTGVLMTPGLQMAIVQPAGGGEPERLRVGEAPAAAGSWRLVAVSPRAAVFEGPEGERSLELRSYDGGADARSSAPMPEPRRRAGNAPPPTPVEPVDEAGPLPAPPGTVEEADMAPTPEETMEAIRRRIEARREQLRREARQTPDPQQR